MSIRNGTLVLAVLALALTGCGDPAGPDPEAAAGGESAEQAAGERERQEERARREAESKRADAVERSRERLRALREDLDALRNRAEPVRASLGESIRGAVSGLSDRVGRVEDAVADLADVPLDRWQDADRELSEDLDAIRVDLDSTSTRLAGQIDVLERRERERRPITGLFEALDGGNYEAYLVSVVRAVQRELIDRGYYPGPADGFLGGPTMEALARFQEDHGIVANGVPTPATRARLLSG